MVVTVVVVVDDVVVLVVVVAVDVDEVEVDVDVVTCSLRPSELPGRGQVQSQVMLVDVVEVVVVDTS